MSSITPSGHVTGWQFQQPNENGNCHENPASSEKTVPVFSKTSEMLPLKFSDQPPSGFIFRGEQGSGDESARPSLHLRVSSAICSRFEPRKASK